MVNPVAEISKKLDEVLDPHFKVGLNDMGMVTDIALDAGHVKISMRCPCLGCPAWRMMKDNVRQQVSKLDFVDKVSINVDWENMWSRDDMSHIAREKAKSHGYVI